MFHLETKEDSQDESYLTIGLSPTGFLPVSPPKKLNRAFRCDLHARLFQAPYRQKSLNGAALNCV
jgi:hypothetical protein